MITGKGEKTMKSPFRIRGYIEGYYGKAHTPEERACLFKYMKKIRMNAYMYAPKDDPLHRSQWRIPYPKKAIAEFKTLVAKARQCGIDFIYALSPGLSIRFTDRKDFSTLLKKYRQMADAGVKTFALLMDDIPGTLSSRDKRTFKRPGLAQTDLANRLQEQLKDCRFLFCPTEYCDEFAMPCVLESQYLDDISRLHPEINVFWTGPDVISQKITGPLCREVASALKRRVIIWDNFHANDYTVNRLFLGPLTGRDGTLPSTASGYMTNMTEYLHANLIPLYTVGDYTLNPGTYRPERSFQKAVRSIEKGAERHIHLLRSFYNTPFEYGKEAKRMLQQLRSARLPIKKAKGIMDMLWDLTNVIKNRALFNELYRFSGSLLKDFRLYTLYKKVNRKNMKTFREYYLRQRNLSSVFVDTLVKRLDIV
jgi:protein O-GlcNAcase/histone acetyltransferase